MNNKNIKAKIQQEKYDIELLQDECNSLPNGFKKDLLLKNIEDKENRIKNLLEDLNVLERNEHNSPCILIVTVTDTEARAVLHTFTTIIDRAPIGNKTYYNLGIHNQSQIYMVISEMGNAQPGGSLVTILQAIEAIQPRVIIMCGIAFGLKPKKQKIGDILISKTIEYYEAGKINLENNVISRGNRIDCPDKIFDRFRSGILTWSGAPVHTGLILSGEKLVNNPIFRDMLLQIEPEAIGGEMEGAGLYVATRNTNIDWILIKGIADWADGNKNDKYQELAVQNSARFIYHVIYETKL